MKRLFKFSARSTFIVFLVLTAIFCAQMAWWIIFQVSSADKTREFFLDTVERERQWTIALLNRRYADIFATAREISGSLSGDEPAGVIFADPAVSGVALESKIGRPDLSDSLYFRLPSGDDQLLIFLVRDYPQIIITANEHLIYQSAARGEISHPNWIGPGNVMIKEAVTESIAEERNRHIKMFLMEGSFFILLIGLGAYLIYLALARSRRIRKEQLLFVHSVTHELKIPLTSMSLFLDTIRRRNYESQIVSDLVPKMKEDVGRLNRLIDNILQVRKLADRETEARLEIIDLSSELRRFASGVSERVESTGGKLVTEILDGIQIRADLTELEKVWESLVDNTVKYYNENSLVLIISLKKNKDAAEIKFLDNGPGIPSGMERRLFEPFVRANINPKKSVPGSGLGLYIAREYVRRSGGSIAIGNAPGGGCQVTMRFRAAS